MREPGGFLLARSCDLRSCSVSDAEIENDGAALCNSKRTEKNADCFFKAGSFQFGSRKKLRTAKMTS